MFSECIHRTTLKRSDKKIVKLNRILQSDVFFGVKKERAKSTNRTNRTQTRN